MDPAIFMQAAQEGQDLSLEGNGYRWLFSWPRLSAASNWPTASTRPYSAVKRFPRRSANSWSRPPGTDGNLSVCLCLPRKTAGKAEISLRVAELYAGKTVYVYYLNEENQPVQAAMETVTEDARLTFSTDHCSLWFISEQAVAAANSAEGLPVWAWVLIGVGAALLLAAGGVAVWLVLKKRQAEGNG